MLMMIRIDWIRKPAWYACACHLLCRAVVDASSLGYICPSSWNAIKVAYQFGRYYPLAVSPFRFWGFIGNHEKRLCESYFRALYACNIPTVRFPARTTLSFLAI